MDEAEYCNRIALINGGKLVALGSPSELKPAPFGGEILLVECGDPGATLAALAGAPAVRDVALFGNRPCTSGRQRRQARCAGDLQSFLKARQSRLDANRADQSRRSRTCSCSSSARQGASRMNLRRIRAIAGKEVLQICATRAA